MDLENLYCMPNDLPFELKLGGNFDIGSYRAIQLILKRCRNDGENY